MDAASSTPTAAPSGAAASARTSPDDHAGFHHSSDERGGGRRGRREQEPAPGVERHRRATARPPARRTAPRRRPRGRVRNSARRPATSPRACGTTARDAGGRSPTRPGTRPLPSTGRLPARRPPHPPTGQPRSAPPTRRRQPATPPARPWPSTASPRGLHDQRAEVLLVAGGELGHRVAVARPAHVLQGVGRGHAAEPAARLEVRARTPCPFMKPPRKASPTPVGSTMAAGGTAGMSMVPVAQHDRRALLALRHHHGRSRARSIAASSRPVFSRMIANS